MTVTNGTVEYERVVRPADFESKRAKVSLSYTVEDGSDEAAVTAKVMAMAVSEVHGRLGIAQPVNYLQADVDALDAKTAPKPRGRPRAIPAEVPAENPPATPGTNPSSDPAGMQDSGTPPPSATGPTVTPAASPTDDPAAITVDDTPASVEQPEIVITDKDLQMAANEAVAQKAPSKAIVALIEEFTNPPGTPPAERIPGKRMTTMEPARRAEYLARLKALYANA